MRHIGGRDWWYYCEPCCHNLFSAECFDPQSKRYWGEPERKGWVGFGWCVTIETCDSCGAADVKCAEFAKPRAAVAAVIQEAAQ